MVSQAHFGKPFQSVFSPKSPTSLKAMAQKTLQDLHDIGSYTKMQDIEISSKGIECLLKKLNPHKASGPDQLKPIVLQTLHKELAPILEIIFQRFLDQGKVPTIWKEANVSPIFKKGDKTDCPLYSRKGTRLTQPTTAPYRSHVFFVKYWNTSWQTFQNISRTRISYMTSESGGPARPS